MAGPMSRLLRIEEAAEVLGVSRETLRRMARRGEVPCAKLGVEWRFPADIAEIVMRAAHVQRTDRTPGAHVGEVC